MEVDVFSTISQSSLRSSKRAVVPKFRINFVLVWLQVPVTVLVPLVAVTTPFAAKLKVYPVKFEVSSPVSKYIEIAQLPAGGVLVGLLSSSFEQEINKVEVMISNNNPVFFNSCFIKFDLWLQIAIKNKGEKEMITERVKFITEQGDYSR